MLATPSEHFSQLASSCRRATEALSQAETLCGQFAASSRRGYCTSAGVTAEQQITKIEDAFNRCNVHCQETRRSPLWSNVSMSVLQQLSSLQRQRLDSMRQEVEDAERQLRILSSRHAPNLAKYRNTVGNNNNSNSNISSSSSSRNDNSINQQQNQNYQNNQSTPNYVANVLEEQQQQNKLLTEEEIKKKERESLTRVVGGVRTMVSESNAVLGALRQQRNRMQDTDSRLSQVLSNAGVAQSVVKQLERMTTVDKVIVFGGMFALIIFMIYLWFSVLGSSEESN